MILSTLYKKTNAGAIQGWSIGVEGATITTLHGHVGGATQQTSDTITEGKNVGKANATTPQQQAEAEARAKWTKQKKKGYVETIEAAQAGEVDALIEGGILPMLAPTKIYPHFAKHLKFPIWQQPKLDGERCIAQLRSGKCTLWTRTRKPILTMPHIVAAIEAYFGSQIEGDLDLDGELYNHDLRHEFESLISAIRNGDTRIQYHIYDLPMERTFFYRKECVRALFVNAWDHAGMKPNDVLHRVDTAQAIDDYQIKLINEMHMEMGYEGSMLRNDGPYEGGKRSMHLQKLKSELDAEFKIIGAEEGRGKDAGTVGAFVCVTAEGKEFRARLKTSYARRAELLQNPAQWQGKKLTVTYQNLTADGIPRFPRGKAIRDYE